MVKAGKGAREVNLHDGCYLVYHIPTQLVDVSMSKYPRLLRVLCFFFPLSIYTFLSLSPLFSLSCPFATPPTPPTPIPPPTPPLPVPPSLLPSFPRSLFLQIPRHSITTPQHQLTTSLIGANTSGVLLIAKTNNVTFNTNSCLLTPK